MTNNKSIEFTDIEIIENIIKEVGNKSLNHLSSAFGREAESENDVVAH
ncbi:hypothetical protein [Shewanella baltica]|nr:hypothetical protein [Shewanella baltica]MCS6098201.1 hypothetical protein [Shewanella baltica]MCS6229240.1 hypothetical protein [Shewanella baltica]